MIQSGCNRLRGVAAGTSKHCFGHSHSFQILECKHMPTELLYCTMWIESEYMIVVARPGLGINEGRKI